MKKLEVVVLQQHEEGGCQERKPGQGVGGEENNSTGLQANERNNPASYPLVILHRLPFKQSPHPNEVGIRPEMGDMKARRQCCKWWYGSRRLRAQAQRRKMKSSSTRKQMRK
jgi:hypothetical protein